MLSLGKKVHITLQGKGGVGKSFAASLLVQYHQEYDPPVMSIDTDPVNATLSGYQAFATRRIELMDGSHLNERKFDEMMEAIFAEESHFVVDNGAASFIPLSNYLIENGAIDLIAGTGKQVVIHSVITGGQALLDTLGGFIQLATQMPESAQIVV
jgi:CO dehydrogenase nickel-insertion accessory protein CooC1